MVCNSLLIPQRYCVLVVRCSYMYMHVYILYKKNLSGFISE